MIIDPARGGCISRSSYDASPEEQPVRPLYRRSVSADVERYPRIPRREHTFPSAVDEGTPRPVRERPPLASRNIQGMNSEYRAARAKLSGLPYVSTKQPQGAPALNCQVRVPADSTDVSKGSREVVCRHFAMDFARHSGKKREMLESFKDESGVQNVFKGRYAKLEKDYLDVAFKDTASHPRKIIEAGRLGECMAALAESLPAPTLETASKADFLIATRGHAMALHVQRKVKEGAPPYCEATFYDPNDTSLVKRVKVQKPEDFDGLSIKSMLVSQKLIDEYSGGDPSHEFPIAVISVSDQQSADLTGIKEAKISSSQIIMALVFGSTECLRHTSDELSGIPAERFVHLMMDKLHSDGVERSAHDAFGNLITYRDADAVEAAVRIVTESNLGFEDKKSMLKGEGVRSSDGSGFEMLSGALLLNSEAVKGFAGAVLGSSKLSSSEMIELLMVGHEEGVPAFHLAMNDGSADTVREFAEAVMNSPKLDSSQKACLLRSESEQGPDAISAGFRMKNTGLVGTLIQTIGRHESSREERLEIMFGTAPYDDSASFRILKANNCLEDWLPDDLKDYFSRRGVALSHVHPDSP